MPNKLALIAIGIWLVLPVPFVFGKPRAQVPTDNSATERQQALQRQQEEANAQETTKAQWWLVYVGIAQAIALVGTLAAIGYQGWKTAEAAEATQEAAEATREAAQATEQNVAAVLAIERAWVDVSLTYVGPAIYHVSIANLGRTIAVVKYFTIMLDFPEGFELASHERGLPRAKILASNVPWTAIRLNLVTELSKPVWEKVEAGKGFSYYGTLHYEDMAGKPHTTEFRFVYERQEGLVQLEAPEYNKHT